LSGVFAAPVNALFIMFGGFVGGLFWAFLQHDEELIQRFVDVKIEAWLRKGRPFQLWLTSLACKVLDVTFAMNIGWAKSRENCARLLVYQSAQEPPGDLIYHPSLVGPDFFHKTGAVL
jgi:hypothetical protein